MTNVATLPTKPGESIADQLRALADQVEAGDFGAVCSITWVADIGGQVEVGHLGITPLPGAVAHLILAMGMRKLELG